jgi:glycosyltransferase involved in cell wall biosynthesis
MKIAIVTNTAPFIYGGAEFHADALRDSLLQAGHDVETIRIPFQWHPPELILDQILAVRLMRLENVDRVIAMKFPAYYIPHPHKIIWLIHQFRQAYDLWGTEHQCIPDTPAGAMLRRAIHQADNTYLPEASKIFTNNPVVAQRLLQFNQISAEPLYPPPQDIEMFYEGQQGDYYFCPSRINRSKRQALMIEAMRHCKTDARLLLVGPPDDRADLEECQSLIRRYRVEDRVELRGTFIPQAEKIELFANSLGCVFIPYHEDHGLVTLEAYQARKPVITTSDSGGVLAFVEDGRSGRVVPPTAEALAEAMDELFVARDQARGMGAAGLENVRRMNITWDNVVARLTQ